MSGQSNLKMMTITIEAGVRRTLRRGLSLFGGRLVATRGRRGEREPRRGDPELCASAACVFGAEVDAAVCREASSLCRTALMCWRVVPMASRNSDLNSGSWMESYWATRRNSGSESESAASVDTGVPLDFS